MVDQLAYADAIPERHRPVFGISLSPLSHEMLARRILLERVPAGEGVRLVVTANLDHVSHLIRNVRFQAAYASAWVATADGMPVYLYARWRDGAPRERVTGADLSADLLRSLDPEFCRPFFVTSSDEAGHRLQKAMLDRGFPREAVAFATPAFGFENDSESCWALARAIRSHGTTHLFFGLGAPKSEIWLHEHRHLLGDCYALAIGASLDFHVGLRRRAPVFLQRAGLEWAWRVACEPRRLFRRYFIESRYAVWAILMDLFGTRPAAHRPVPRS